jgi:hypothetical protein
MVFTRKTASPAPNNNEAPPITKYRAIEDCSINAYVNSSIALSF